MPAHYDALFRRLFEMPEVSADFIRNYLPVGYQGKIDFESATIDSDTYIDEVSDGITLICCTTTNHHRTNGCLYSSCVISCSSTGRSWISWACSVNYGYIVCALLLLSGCFYYFIAVETLFYKGINY